MSNPILAPAGAALPVGRIPGNSGIWVGITCEFVEFTVLFSVYFAARAYYPAAFHAGPNQLSSLAGTTITLLMVTSSYCIANSLHAIRHNKQRSAVIWLTSALFAALGYPLVKYLEIRWNLAHEINGNAGIFFSVYYYLTLNHLVHASWGILGILFVLVRLAFGGYSADNHAGLEALGSYWHATDMIWLVMFPLFYVLA